MSISYSNSNVGMCGFFGIAVCEHAVGFSFFCDRKKIPVESQLINSQCKQLVQILIATPVKPRHQMHFLASI